MSVEVIGTVTKIGKVKDYGHPINWDKDWQHIFKFFMEVTAEDGTVYNAMVMVDAEETQYGWRIPKDKDRQRPFIGDTVKISSHRVKENGAKWLSVTWNQTYKIVKENKKARKEREQWIAEKKAEREKEKQEKVEKVKQDSLDYELEVLGHLESLRYDERIPSDVREKISKTFNFDTIIGLLRDTAWFVTPEGEGGKQCYHYPPCGCGYPGTGLRRPNGVLYGQPKTVRKSILSKALDSGLIVETPKGFKATEKGVELLLKFDICPDCNEVRRPYDITAIIAYERSSSRQHVGIRYLCKDDLKAYENRQGCNVGYIVNGFKHTPKLISKALEDN